MAQFYIDSIYFKQMIVDYLILNCDRAHAVRFRCCLIECPILTEPRVSKVSLEAQEKC